MNEQIERIKNTINVKLEEAAAYEARGQMRAAQTSLDAAVMNERLLNILIEKERGVDEKIKSLLISASKKARS